MATHPGRLCAARSTSCPTAATIVAGTIDYRARLNKLDGHVQAGRRTGAAPAAARRRTSRLTLADTILLTDPAGTPLTGLDPAAGVQPPANGLPTCRRRRTAMSRRCRGGGALPDGSFFISDEYGPYVYRFSAEGRHARGDPSARRVHPEAQRRDHFSSNNPGPGAERAGAAPIRTPAGEQPGIRRYRADARWQSWSPSCRARRGRTAATRRRRASNTRMLYYDSRRSRPSGAGARARRAAAVFTDADGKRRVAAQSELAGARRDALPAALPRQRQRLRHEGATSLYRSVEMLDTSRRPTSRARATTAIEPVAPSGGLVAAVVPATLTPLHRSQRQCPAGPLRPAQRRAERPQQPLGEMGRHGARAGARSGATRTTSSCSSPTTTTSSPSTAFRSAPPTRTSPASRSTRSLVYRVTLPDFAK